MKMEGMVAEVRSVSDLHNFTVSLSEEGWRIVTVLDVSADRGSGARFLIVAQREPELVVTVADNGR